MIIDLRDGQDGRIAVTATRADGCRMQLVRLPARIEIEEKAEVRTTIEARILGEENDDDEG